MSSQVMLGLLVQGPCLANHHSPSVSLTYSSPVSLEHEGSGTLSYWMHLTHGLLPPMATLPHPLITEIVGLTFPFPLNLLQPSLCCFTVWPPQSFSLHIRMWLFAICFSLTPCVSSHPSLSARFSYPGFLWHPSVIFIHLTVQIFTFLKPSVFLWFLLL